MVKLITIMHSLFHLVGRQWIYLNSLKSKTFLSVKDSTLKLRLATTFITWHISEFQVNKHYPREQARDHIHSGRVRVKLLNEERNPVNPDYPKRQDILLLACELIPKLKTRQTRSMDVADTAQGNKKRKGKRK